MSLGRRALTNSSRFFPSHQNPAYETVPSFIFTSLSGIVELGENALDSQVRDWRAFRICYRRTDDCVGIYGDGMGNAQSVRMGLHHRRGRTDWERLLGYVKRCDSQSVAQILSRAYECVGLAVSGTADSCQVRMMQA